MSDVTSFFEYSDRLGYCGEETEGLRDTFEKTSVVDRKRCWDSFGCSGSFSGTTMMRSLRVWSRDANKTGAIDSKRYSLSCLDSFGYSGSFWGYRSNFGYYGEETEGLRDRHEK